jgi:hypothetical protein
MNFPLHCGVRWRLSWEAAGEAAFADFGVTELVGLLGSDLARRAKPLELIAGAAIRSPTAPIRMLCPVRRSAEARWPRRISQEVSKPCHRRECSRQSDNLDWAHRLSESPFTVGTTGDIFHKIEPGYCQCRWRVARADIRHTPGLQRDFRRPGEERIVFSSAARRHYTPFS